MKQQATNASATMSNLAFRGMDVLVKFHFSNPDLIPVGIEQKRRPADEVIDFARHHTTKNKKLAQFDRHREGRVDTGEPVIENLGMVQAAMLRKGLASNGYRLVDAHWFEKQREGKTPQYVVVLSFRHEAEESVELARNTLDAIRHLARTVWQFCHVWRNADKKNFTVNFVGLQPNGKQKNSLVARDGEFLPITAFSLVEEDAE